MTARQKMDPLVLAAILDDRAAAGLVQDSRPDLYVGFLERNAATGEAVNGQLGWGRPAEDAAADAARAAADEQAEASWLALLGFTAIAGFAVGAFVTAALAYVWSLFL